MERRSRTKRRLGLLPVLVLALSAAMVTGCEEATAPEEITPDLKLIIENRSSVTINVVNFSFCHRTEWGENRLPNGETIRPNHKASWTLSESGCYDLRAVSTGGAEVTDFDVEINGHFTWKIN